MATRVKFSDARWFADYRPVCEIENEIKRELRATNEWEYAELLQKNAKSVFNKIRKVPIVNVPSIDMSSLHEYNFIPNALNILSN